MKETILNEFLMQHDVRNIVINKYRDYFNVHGKRGGALKNKNSLIIKIKEAQCDFLEIDFSNDDIESMYAILLGNYLDEDQYYIDPNRKIFFQKSSDPADKSYKKFEFTINYSTLEYSNTDIVSRSIPMYFERKRVAKHFCEFFSYDTPKENYWPAIASLSACWIIDNKLNQFLKMTDSYKKLYENYPRDNNDNVDRCKIFTAIILQNFLECNIARKEKVKNTKSRNRRKASPEIFPVIDTAEELLFGKSVFTKSTSIIAKNKIGVSSKKSKDEFDYRISFNPKSIEAKFFKLVTNGYDCFKFQPYYTDEEKHECTIKSNKSPKTKRKADCIKQLENHFTLYFEEQVKYLKDAARQIVEEVNQQPLMRYLYKKLDERKQTSYLYEYRELVKSIAKCNKNGELIILPPVRTLMEQIRNGIKKYTANKFFNETDVYEILGELAISATQAVDYNIPPEKLQQTNDIFRSKIIEQIMNDIQNRKFRWITFDGESYRFALKHYRILFAAHIKSEQYNAKFIMHKNDISTLCTCILEEMKMLPSESIVHINIEDSNMASNTNHTEWSFDSLVVFGTALLLSSHTSIMYSIIDQLCIIAQNFSVHNQNRQRQESAISLICNLLSEKYNFLPDFHEKMFRSTYGKSIYHFQISAWNNMSMLYKTSKDFPGFTELVYQSIEKACRLDADRRYANGAPYYILLKGYIDDRLRSYDDVSFDEAERATRYLYECCKIQSKVWNINSKLADDDEIKTRYSIICLLKEVHSIFTKWEISDGNVLNAEDKYPLAWVYGCNMLLYALADIERKINKSGFYERILCDIDTTEFNAQSFIETIVLCDYFNRKLSFRYDHDYDSVNCTADDIFLLCGSFRITSIDTFISETFTLPYRFVLSQNQIDDYNRWLNIKEKSGRYKVLLTRYLLVCTKYFDICESLPLADTDFADGFLTYDSVSPTEVAEIKSMWLEGVLNKDDFIKQILTKSYV